MSTPAPFFPQSHLQTNKTYETYSLVSNHDFLSAIFKDVPADVGSVLASFAGAPGAENKRQWAAKSFLSASDLPSTHNNYFTPSVYNYIDGKIPQRTKKNFVACYAFVLDDVGTKISKERITASPSWIIETSEGNFQYGYIFDTPINDAVFLDKFTKAFIEAELTDAGANGFQSRLMRLPVGFNGKPTSQFQCQLKHWESETRYSPDELLAAFELEMTHSRHAKNQIGAASRVTHAEPTESDDIYIPSPAENAVIAELKKRDLYKKPLGDGKHDITCINVHLHTDAVNNGTVYFEPNPTYPLGGLKCHHGHCAHLHIRELLQFLGIESAAARMRPIIRVNSGDLHRVVAAIEGELASAHYYQRGGNVVRVHTSPSTGETFIEDLSQASLMDILSQRIIFEQYDRRSSLWVRIDPPIRHVTVFRDKSDYPILAVLKGIARQPYLRAGDILVTESGYDSLSKLFGAFNTRDYVVPANPTPDEINVAAALLDSILEEFAFVSRHDHAAALSAIFTATLRPSLPTAPMFHVKAHSVGSGKSYLCNLFTVFATEQQSSPTSFANTDEEMLKVLIAMLMRSPAVIQFDNMTHDLFPHKSLCTALTTEYMEGRILGASKTIQVSTRTLFLSSGNNVDPSQDMIRRCITINLDPDCENPAMRTFKNPNLVHDVLRERGKYVSAVLTLVQAYIVAGKPIQDCKPLAGFDDWSVLCRQILLWLGHVDPLASVFAAMQDDPDRELLARLLELWSKLFGDKPTRVGDACTNLNGDLQDLFDDIAGERGEVNRRKLGKWLKRHTGRIVNGLRLKQAGGTHSSVLWIVERVK